VSEQLVLNEVVRERAAVDRDERIVATGAEIVNCACGELLAGAGLSLNERGYARRGEPADDPDAVEECRLRANEVREERVLHGAPP
jgi:hypothetical protein